MLRPVLLLALVCAGSAEVVLKELGSTEKEGLSHKSYVLVDGQDQDGKDTVVGYIQHIRAGPAALGRRAGPPEGMGMGPVLLPVLDSLFAQMHASRCAMMRAMADDFSRSGMLLAPLLLVDLANQSQPGPARVAAPMFGAQPTRAGVVALPPFQLRAMPWQDRSAGPAHYFGGMAEHHRMMGQEGAEWMDLEDDSMPTMNDEINWSFYNDDGSLNVGLLMFVLLSTACLGVWIAGFFSWLAYCRQMREQRHSRVQFLTSKGALPKKGSADLLAPLMHEGPADAPKLYTGIEFAADHADPNAPKGAALQYEPPKP